MRVFKNVEGGMDVVDEVAINNNHVYVRWNIRRNDRDTLWIYDEIQYTLREYIDVLSRQFDDTSKYLKNILEVGDL